MGAKLATRGALIEHVIEVVEGQVRIEPFSNTPTDTRNLVIGLGRFIGKPQGSHIHQYTLVATTPVKVRVTSYEYMDRLADSDPSLFYTLSERFARHSLNQASYMMHGATLTDECIQSTSSKQKITVNQDILDKLRIEANVFESVATTYSKQAGDCIVNFGAPARVALIILDGKVSVLSPTGELIRHLGPGDTIGFTHLIGSIFPWQCSLFAAVNSTVAAIDTAKVRKQNPSIGGKLLRTFTRLACQELGNRILHPVPQQRIPLSTIGPIPPQLATVHVHETPVLTKATTTAQHLGGKEVKEMPKLTAEDAAVVIESQQVLITYLQSQLELIRAERNRLVEDKLKSRE